MKRIQHLFNTLKTNWSDDPAARGAAKMTAGAILVAEGLFGVVSGMATKSRKSSARGNTKNIGGLLGHLILCVMGVVFIFAGIKMAPGDYPDEVRTTGKVAKVDSERNREGKTMYRAIYSFETADQEYRFKSLASSNLQPSIGDPVEIAYSAADPSKSRRVDGIEGRMHWIFLGSGALMSLAGLIGVAISLALIGFGVWLFLAGRKDRISVNASGGFISDLMSLAKRARNGEIDIKRTAVGMAGSQQGDIDLFSQLLAGDIKTPAAAPAPPPPSSLPPAVWFADPNDSSRQRWWDGAQWTDHHQ
jgi:hypothetical protein